MTENEDALRSRAARLEAAIDMVLTARHLAIQGFDNISGRRIKSDGSEVTDTDHLVEDLLRVRLHEQFPDDGVMGEEREPTHGRSGGALGDRPDRRHL